MKTTLLLSMMILMCWSVLLVEGQVNCPPLNDFNTCGCSNNGGGTIWLDCGNAQLGDAKASQLLKLFINNPAVSPLTGVYLAYNKLTKIPDEIAQLNQLHTVYLHGNDINSIPSGAFNFVPTLKELYLSDNPLKTIQQGAFNGNYGYGSVITLGNQLTRFESDVFRSVVEQIQPYAPDYARINIGRNPIDCANDPCHLAWIVRDNPIMMNAIPGAQCSNGTLLRSLNPSTLCFKQETFLCPSLNGFYANPSSCTSYYQCSNSIPYKFDCPVGLVFNPVISGCDYASNVPSCKSMQ